MIFAQYLHPPLSPPTYLPSSPPQLHPSLHFSSSIPPHPSPPHSFPDPFFENNSMFRIAFEFGLILST